MSDRRSTRHLLLALSAAAILRLLALAVPIDPHMAPDSHSFVLLSESLLEDGRLAYEDPGAPGVELRAFRSLLYPIVLAASKGAHAGTAGALVLQALLGIVVVACIFRIGRDTLGTAFGVLAAWIGALYWGSAFYERQVLSESLYTAFLVVGVTLALPALQSRGRTHPSRRRDNMLALVAGLAFGLAGVTKPAGVLTVAAVVAISLAFILIHRRSGGDRENAPVSLARLAMLVLGVAIVVAPAIARNQAVLGRPVLLTSGGMNFWMGNHVGTIGDAWRIMGEEVSERGEVGMDRWFYQDTWNHRGEIVSQAPRLLAQKCWAFFAPTTRTVHQWPHRLILPFVIIGLFLARPGKWHPWAVVCTVVFTHVALGLFIVPDPRYRTPIDPFSWLLAAAAIVLLWRKGKTGRGVIAGIIALNLAVRLVQ